MSASPKHDLTQDERDAITMLRGVTYPSASFDKRFSAHLQDCLKIGTIGEKARPQLWRIFIKYRRQTAGQRKVQLLAYAETQAAPDLRKVNAAAREQAEIDRLKQQAAHA